MINLGTPLHSTLRGDCIFALTGNCWTILLGIINWSGDGKNNDIQEYLGQFLLIPLHGIWSTNPAPSFIEVKND